MSELQGLQHHWSYHEDIDWRWINRWKLQGIFIFEWELWKNSLV